MRQLILSLILANFIIYTIIFSALNEKKLVSFLDVGQGEAVLIKNKNNIYLYDTGKYPSLILKEIDKFLPFYNKKIDILFLSHPDKDHYFAAFEILKRYKVRVIAVSTKQSQDRNYEELLATVQRLKIPVLVLRQGSQIYDNHFNFLILNPNRKYKKDNDKSLVIKLAGKYIYLLTGDIEKEAIKNLIDCCSKFLKADYFLVPHHGSRHSINEKFYSLIQPYVAIIQVGQNYYSHPHRETLNILKNYAVTIWRTDIQKALIINE